MQIVITDKTKVIQLVTIFRHLKSLTEMVNIILTEDKFYIQGLDASHACLIEISILAEWFDSYESESLTLGVSCEILFKVINCWKEKQAITMESTYGGDKLFINFAGEKTLTKDFALPLINIEPDVMTIPATEYQVDLALGSEIFKELINEQAIFSDTINFKSADDTVSMVANGDSGRMNITINDDDIEELAIEEDFELDTSAGINYVSHVCNFAKLNPIIYIHCSEGSPIKFHYSLDEEDSVESKSYARFFVAPKIDD